MVAAIPIMIIEKQSALESMKGSYGLSRGHPVYIFNSDALLWLLFPTLATVVIAQQVYRHWNNQPYLSWITYKALYILSFLLWQM
jgi:hypothetical protein